MVRRRPPGGKPFALIGNHRCVDFVNTEALQAGQRVDLLGDLSDLVAWLATVRLLEPAEASGVLRRWGGTTGGARAVAEARKLRGHVRAMLERIAAGRPIPAAALGAVNALLARHTGRGEVVRAAGRFVRRFRLEPREPVDLLVPVAEAASDLLCHANFSLVRKCENPPCFLYFYDTSKNHARRWCSMSVCGNRAKVAAYHRRARRRPAASRGARGSPSR